MAGGNSLLNFGIFCDQAGIRSLPINKPEQFFHAQGFVWVTAIHEKFCFRFVCKHVHSKKRERGVFDEARSFWMPIVRRCKVRGAFRTSALSNRSLNGAPVQVSGHPGQHCPLYLPRTWPISRTTGNKIRWINTGGVTTPCVRRCRQST